MNRFTHIKRAANYYGSFIGIFMPMVAGFLGSVYKDSSGTLPRGLTKIAPNAYVLSLVMLSIIVLLISVYLFFFSLDTQIRNRAAKYYAWFLGMCTAWVVSFMYGANVRSSHGSLIPGLSRVVSNADVFSFILLSLIFLLAFVYLFFFVSASDTPRNVKITDTEICYDGIKRSWQDIEDVEIIFPHLHLIWKDGTRIRIYLRRVSYDVDSCCSHKPFKMKYLFRFKKCLEFWWPLIKLLEKRVALRRAKAMLDDLHRGKVPVFDYYLFSRTDRGPGAWTTLLLSALLSLLAGYMVGSTPPYFPSPVPILFLFMVEAQRGFAWVDTNGLGIFKICAGFRYMKLGEDVRLQMTPIEIRLLDKKHVRRGLAFRQSYGIEFPKYLTLRSLLMLECPGYQEK